MSPRKVLRSFENVAKEQTHHVARKVKVDTPVGFPAISHSPNHRTPPSSSSDQNYSSGYHYHHGHQHVQQYGQPTQHQQPSHSPPSPLSSSTDTLKQPEPPRSAFICFKDHKKMEILAKQGTINEKDDTLNNVAAEWRKLSDKDRAYWDEQAREDKVRFVREKAAYKGPWNIPKRRAKKHPLAPKRPMSAFLKFSKTRRNKVKQDNPTMENTDVSRLLGEMWRNASAIERAPYVESEERERAEYKEEIKKWRCEQAQMDATTRTSHQSAAASHHQHQQQPKPPPSNHHPATFELRHPNASHNGSFENFTSDPLMEDHSSRRSAFRQHYPNHHHTYHRPPYRPEYYSTEGHNQQPSWPDLSLQHSLEHDSDPLPVVPTRMHPSAQSNNHGNDDYVGGHYASRNHYYQEMPRYSRYI